MNGDGLGNGILMRPGESYAGRTQIYVQNFPLSTRRDVELHIEGEWLCLWRLLGSTPAAGETYPLNYRYRANLTVHIRFDAMDNPQIPFEFGDIIRVPYKRIFLSTVVAGGAAPTGTVDLLYGKGPIELAKGNASQLLLLQDLLFYYEHSYFLYSTVGGDEVLTPAAATPTAGSNQPCVEATFWTPDAQVHFHMGAGNATAADPLLPANAPFTIPVANTNQLKFYNAAGVGATINIVWRA